MIVLSKRVLLFSLFLSNFIWISSISARMSPTSWFGFINSTDVIVKGEVISAKQVSTKSGVRYVKVGINIESTILVNDKSKAPDKEISIYIWGQINPINVGNKGYFFITENSGKWFSVDWDIGTWKLTKILNVDLNNEVVNYRLAPNIFEFPFSVLSDFPDILRQKLRYIDDIDYDVNEQAIEEELFFTEAGLLEYFNSEPCRLGEKASVIINENIKKYLKSKVIDPSSERLEHIDQSKYLSYKNIGTACAFREIEGENQSFFKVILVDKKTELALDDITIERQGVREKWLREQQLWELYKQDFDSLE